MTIPNSTLEKWGLVGKKRRPVKKNQRSCPKCMKPQVLKNFSFGKAYVCGNEHCHYKRPYTVGGK